MKRKIAASIAAVSFVQIGLITGCGTHGNGNQTAGSNANQAAASASKVSKVSNQASTGTNTANVSKASSGGQQQAWPKVSVREAGQLPQGVEGNTLVMSPQGPVSVGGYTGRVSITNIYRLQPNIQSIGHLAARTHDAAAAYLGQDLYVLGGGQAVSYNTIVELPHGSSQANTVGRLSAPLSDAAALTFHWQGKQGIVRIGGYNGTDFRQTAKFFTLTNGQLHAAKMFQMPIGLRYTAVTSKSGTIYIAGGKTRSHGFSSSIYSWSSQQGLKKLPVKLSYGIDKAALFTDGRYLLLAGGENKNGVPTRNILAINVQTGKVKVVGKLPVSLADFGYTQQGTKGFIAGGKTNASGSSISSKVYEIRW